MPIAAEQFATLFADLDAYLNSTRATSLAPGMFASMTYRDSVVWSAAYGTTVANSTSPPSLDTIFSVGSVTKVFTALQAFQMAERGQVSIHDALSKFEPRFQIQDPFGPTAGPTIHQMLAQSAGMPRELPCNSLFCNISLADILPAIAQQQLVAPPYTRAAYSNGV